MKSCPHLERLACSQGAPRGEISGQEAAKVGLLVGLSLLVLRAYKFFISPLLGERCRFYPSCADYTAEALRKYGLLKGLLLSMKRICRCNPLCAGGIDPVP